MSGKFPFSSSLKAGSFVFISGKVGTDPQTGEIAKGDVKKQTLQILNNLEAELQQYGLGLADAVKTTVFLTDMRNFGEMNEVYRSKFAASLPTRSCVSVTALPHVDALVEIEMIAYEKE